MVSTDLNWYSFYTVPNCEKKAINELGEGNIESYVPVQTVYRQWSDRVKKLDVTLFPNYVFFRTMGTQTADVFNIKGICMYVSFEGKPARISNEDILMINKQPE